MKNTLYIILAALCIMACTEQQKKEPNIAEQRADSLQRIIDQKDNELKDVMATFSEIQEGFRLIEAAERNVTLLKDGEATDKAEQIRYSMRNIQQRMEHNRELIRRLQKQVREGSSHSEELHKVLENFTKEMEAKNTELEQLRAQLQEKDIHIAELDQAVTQLNTDVSELQEESAQKTETINEQDKIINTAWYVFGTKKELQEQNIYLKGKVLQSNFNKNYFTKIDIRIDKEVKLYSKYAQIMTPHPASSYTLQPDAQKQYVLRITNPQQFWSTSKYLVILVK